MSEEEEQFQSVIYISHLIFDELKNFDVKIDRKIHGFFKQKLNLY